MGKSKLIADDEFVQFFRTAGVFNNEDNQWHLPVHGWVYEPQTSKFRKALFSWALKLKYGLSVTEDNNIFFKRRLNLLIADNERNKEVTIALAGKEFALPKTSANGHVKAELVLDSDIVEKHRQGSFIDYTATVEDGRQFSGQIQLLDSEGLSVISDIDDTIKISNVLNHQSLIDHTFLQAFFTVEGMSDAYQRLAHNTENHVSFHYVSSSPWQLYEPLQELVDAEEFPWATFSLKAVRFRDMTLFDLFKPGIKTKPLQIQSILQQFPQRQFILIGDSGEHDPEVYSAIAQQNPGRIAHIYIRNITKEQLDNVRFSALVETPSLWTLFTDPASIDFPN